VDLCTVHSEHYPQAKAALQAGYPVLIEKPFATKIEDCEKLVKLAEGKDLCLMIGQCQRYDPSYVAARKAIQTGVLGDIRGVRFDCMQNLEFYVKPGHWLWDGNKAGGGIVISVMVHRLDLMRFLVGDVKRVTAMGKSFHPEMVNGAEDFVTAMLEFENGAIGEAFGTYVGYRLPYSESFMIFGEKGTVHAVPDKGQWMGPAMIAVDGEARKDDESAFDGFETIEGDPSMRHELGFVNEILHFAECCRTGSECDSSGKDNLKTMKVIFGIMESLKTGKSVDII
jgi:predicted dehydrogenase